ncbi:unnamed protein product [Cuscuta campestris]|uniref:Secreted protein n=1 Tax=Cuscuta campestris TaxID=132261 RepID=A0A484K9U9_9ASTE|nr:unnamed protein product [Cuscuta campestris]
MFVGMVWNCAANLKILLIALIFRLCYCSSVPPCSGYLFLCNRSPLLPRCLIKSAASLSTTATCSRSREWPWLGSSDLALATTPRGSPAAPPPNSATAGAKPPSLVTLFAPLQKLVTPLLRDGAASTL